MRINSIQNNSYKVNNQITFKSTERTTYRNCKTQEVYTRPYYSVYEDYLSLHDGINPFYAPVKIENSNYTYFFREDIPNWMSWAANIDKHFSNSEKIHIYDFGCSDGTEAYTIVISLIEALGEDEAEKYFPIKAIDKDEEIIKKAKTKKISCSLKDFEAINAQTDNKFGKYFNIEKRNKDGSMIISPKEILSKNIVFKRENAEEGIGEIKTKDNIIVCRNFIKYLSPDSLRTLLHNLREVDEGTLLVLGDYDLDTANRTPWFISSVGFERSKAANTYVKNNDLIVLYDEELEDLTYSGFIDG